MPTVSDYICEDCYAKRAEIKKVKGAYHEFIHNALNGVGETQVAKMGDKLYVMNGTDPIKRYDATTEEVAPKDLHLPTYKVKPTKTPKEELIPPTELANREVGDFDTVKRVIKSPINPKDVDSMIEKDDQIIKSSRDDIDQALGGALGSTTIEHTTIKTPKDAEKAVEVITKFEEGKKDKYSVDGGETYHPKEKFNQKLCKIHGTPLTENGKCLQKGCKYA